MPNGSDLISTALDLAHDSVIARQSDLEIALEAQTRCFGRWDSGIAEMLASEHLRQNVTAQIE